MKKIFLIIIVLLTALAFADSPYVTLEAGHTGAKIDDTIDYVDSLRSHIDPADSSAVFKTITADEYIGIETPSVDSIYASADSTTKVVCYPDSIEITINDTLTGKWKKGEFNLYTITGQRMRCFEADGDIWISITGSSNDGWMGFNEDGNFWFFGKSGDENDFNFSWNTYWGCYSASGDEYLEWYDDTDGLVINSLRNIQIGDPGDAGTGSHINIMSASKRLTFDDMNLGMVGNHINNDGDDGEGLSFDNTGNGIFSHNITVTGGYIYFDATNYFRYYNNTMYFRINNTDRVIFDTGGMYPASDNARDNGKTGYAWRSTMNYKYYGVEQAKTLSVGDTTFAATSVYIKLTGEGGGNTLKTITGLSYPCEVIIKFVDGNITVSNDDSHAANTIDLDAANDLTSAADMILKLYFDGTSYYRVADSAN